MTHAIQYDFSDTPCFHDVPIPTTMYSLGLLLHNAAVFLVVRRLVTD
jgi:hypothetical protein